MNTEMKNSKFIVIYFLFIILSGSCSLSSMNQEAEESKKNDSIINAHLKALVDSTLSSCINLKLDSFRIINTFRNNDTIKEIKGNGRSYLYDYEKLRIMGSYKVSKGMICCISLKASHSDVGNVFEIYEIYDSLFTYRMDSLTFLKKNQVYEEGKKEKMDEYFYRIERAYANQTKVHFGISREEYNRLGEDFQRNFYEGLVGYGAYELAKPIFNKEKLVGFEIMELHDKSFGYNNVQNNADLVKKEQLGYDAHETYRWIYVCELYNMEIISSYDKFDRKTRKTLKVYWNEWARVFR